MIENRAAGDIEVYYLIGGRLLISFSKDRWYELTAEQHVQLHEYASNYLEQAKKFAELKKMT